MGRRDGPPQADGIHYGSRNPYKAELRREGGVVVKDYGDRPYHVRLLGRLLLSREEAALRRLAGLEGVPRFLGRPTPDSLAMSALPGEPIEKMRRGDLPADFLDNLAELMERMHALGVAHADAHRKNILADGKRAYLVDFCMAYIRPALPVGDDFFFRRFVRLDQLRLAKVERRFFGRTEMPPRFLLYRVAKLFKPRHKHEAP